MLEAETSGQFKEVKKAKNKRKRKVGHLNRQTDNDSFIISTKIDAINKKYKGTLKG